MNKIKKWIKDHQSLIIGLLVLVLMLKGCSACNMERRYEYQQIQYEHVIDSMQSVIDTRSVDVKDLYDTLYSLRSENTILKDVIKDLNADKEHYKIQNRNLITVAENLSKKDTL